jgi:hypothetical protein
MRDPRNGWRHGDQAFEEGRAIPHWVAELACPSGPARGVEGAALPGLVSFRGSLRTLAALSHWTNWTGGAHQRWVARHIRGLPIVPLQEGERRWIGSENAFR